MQSSTVRHILDSRKFEELLGLHEDTFFEAKQSTAYSLDTAAGRYELAKDVSAFANAEGGFVLVGLVTEHLIEQNADRVQKLDLCRREDFDLGKYEGIIKEHIHPKIEGLSVTWLAHASDGSLGLGVIEIPRQDDDRKYFLTARVVEDSTNVRQIVFGLCRRNVSANDPLSINDLYEIVRKGKSPLSEKLTRLEEKVDAILLARSAPQPAESASERLSARIQELFEQR
jgi:predicted HTH transcriptional regulator